MLKLESDFIKEFPIITKTDRDAEAPVLIEFLKMIPLVDSILDIGCHSSRDEGRYGTTLRHKAKLYDGIDIVHDPRLDGFLDHQFTGNAITYPLKKYDLVTCVSTIEHAGLSTYKGDYIKERMNLFMKCLELAKKYLWISFPVGQEYIYPNQLAPITDKQLKRWETLVSNFKVKERFFYTQGAQAGHPWYEHTKRDVAIKIPYIDYIGNQSIGVLEIAKT